MNLMTSHAFIFHSICKASKGYELLSTVAVSSSNTAQVYNIYYLKEQYRYRRPHLVVVSCRQQGNSPHPKHELLEAKTFFEKLKRI